MADEKRYTLPNRDVIRVAYVDTSRGPSLELCYLPFNTGWQFTGGLSAGSLANATALALGPETFGQRPTIVRHRAKDQISSEAWTIGWAAPAGSGLTEVVFTLKDKIAAPPSNELILGMAHRIDLLESLVERLAAIAEESNLRATESLTRTKRAENEIIRLKISIINAVAPPPEKCE